MNQKVLKRIVRNFMDTHPYPGLKGGAILELFNRGRPKKVGDGKVICVEGAAGKGMFVLAEGEVVVSLRDHEGSDREIAVLRAPAFIGHWSLADGAPRSAKVQARGEVVVIIVDEPLFAQLLAERSPEGTALRRLILVDMARGLSMSNQTIADLIRPERKQEVKKKRPSWYLMND